MFPITTKILVVDDFKTQRLNIEKKLRTLGFTGEIIDVPSAQQAMLRLNQAKSEGVPFNLVIADINMPDITGLDLLKEVRASAELKDTPLLMVTAESDPGILSESVNLGVSQVLMKPFTIDELRDKMKAVWEKHNPSK